ncbi:hypothetical protein MLD38_016780 [Melastoma candidum]|uniref:Uncharacterized protein n=1 Tax=Melastoma candidum TaxID=119954 RepID=A0ACB9QRZ7_9MYRT|nr:hypothetical protein MLD38_016780 [Melastoma candidum]
MQTESGGGIGQKSLSEVEPHLLVPDDTDNNCFLYDPLLVYYIIDLRSDPIVHERSTMSFFLLLLLLFLSLFRPSSSSSDTLSASQRIRDGDVLVSGGGQFAFGFFTPGNSGSRFLGIWYAAIPVQTVVWVANRENPLSDTSGFLSVDFQGNLVLRSGNGSSLLWSTNVSLPLVPSSSSPMVRLLDSGNLVLYENVDGNFIRWQSFDYPTNIHLPSMRFGFNKTSGLHWSFTSWRSYDDPRPGNCTYKIDTTGYPQAVIYKEGRPHFRVGSWTGSRWSGIPEMDHSYILRVNFTNDEDEISFTFRTINASFTTSPLPIGSAAVVSGRVM